MRYGFDSNALHIVIYLDLFMAQLQFVLQRLLFPQLNHNSFCKASQYSELILWFDMRIFMSNIHFCAVVLVLLSFDLHEIFCFIVLYALQV